MEAAPCISQIASLLAEPKRTAMLWALMDGSAKSPIELTTLAGLSATSAHAHLARLTAGGLLRVEARRGKRLFRVAAPDVSAAIDALARTTMACAARSAPDALPPTLLAPPSLRHARLCHGHLGGELGAQLYQHLLEAGWIERYEQRTDVTVKARSAWRNWGFLPRHWHRRWCAAALTGASSSRTWGVRWARGCCNCFCSRTGSA